LPGAGFVIQWISGLTELFASGCSDTLAPHGFALFAAAVFTRLFIVFFQLQPFEQAIVLNLFLQNPHGLFKVVVVNLDRDFLQTASPPSFHPRLLIIRIDG
jgi:hypothetical protein